MDRGKHRLIVAGALLSIFAWGCGDGTGADLDMGVVDQSSGFDGSVEDEGVETDGAVDADAEPLADMGGLVPDADLTEDAGTPVDMAVDPDASVTLDLGSDPDLGSPDAGVCSGPDSDGDGIPNACDRCALGADQLDADLDTVPNACDQCVGFSDLVDTDMDGVADGCDACVGGDDDADVDGDGVPDACDSCDLGPNTVDADGDGIPNACDRCALGADQLDADLDTVPNACDQCVGFSDLVDTDMDGVADGCDACLTGDDADDADDDGFPDACDVCVVGPNQLDADADGTPDACDVCSGHDDDLDADSDGVADGCDCEPLLPEARPGLSEVCDGLDNDCSGGVDNGVLGCTVICAPGDVDWDRDGTECEASGRVIYVDATATGAANGTTWADAYVTIEDAIVDVEGMPAATNQIWIAAGEYQPTRQLSSGLVFRGFLIPGSTALLGGFSGGESSVVQADPEAHSTVVTLGPGLLPRLFDVRQPDTVLDGMRAHTASPVGLAVAVTGGTLRASRLVLQGGTSGASGGIAIEVQAGSVTLQDISASGGTIGIDAVGGTVLCERCLITNNIVTSPGARGGGIAISAATVTLRNSAVLDNANITGFGSLAGGVTILGALGRLHAVNSTIAGNSGSRLVPPTHLFAAPAGLDVRAGAATLVNSIVQGNTGEDTVVATIISSSVEGVGGACAPLFTSGYRLGPGSACIDTGDTTMSQGSVDLAGAPRIQGAAVDMGAYETQP